MAITLDGTNGITTPDLDSTGPITGTTGTFSGALQASGVTTNIYPIVSGTSVASTSGTSIDFTSIPSWVKRITVMLSGISTNGTSLFQIQLGDSGGIETTSYVSARGNIDGTNATSVGSATSGFVIRSSVAAATAYTGQAVISNLTGNSWICASFLSASNGTMTTQNGTKTLSDTLDRVRITTVNGTDTFDAGDINILYE